MSESDPHTPETNDPELLEDLEAPAEMQTDVAGGMRCTHTCDNTCNETCSYTGS